MSELPINIGVIPANLEADPDHERLFGTLYINGIAHHLEAIRVSTDGFIQQAYDENLQSNFEAYGEAAGDDGPWQTTELGGKRYCFFVTPHGN